MAYNSKIQQLCTLYAANGKLTNEEAAELLETTPRVIDTYRYRLRDKGFIEINKDRSVTVKAKYKAETSYKQVIYEEMVDRYMEDFRTQTTFVDRLAVGREIRLILEKM